MALSEAEAFAAVYGTLLVFAAVAAGAVWWAGVGLSVSYDKFIAARGTLGPWSIGFSLFAASMGAWLLFAAPEVGADFGPWGVLGYAVAVVIPLGVLAWLGPLYHKELPNGFSATDFMKRRFGRTVQLMIAAVSMFYMFIFVVAEFTAVAGVIQLLCNNAIKENWYIVGGIALVTTIYTAYGGLPASIVTDRLEAVLVFVLVIIGLSTAFSKVHLQPGQWKSVSQWNDQGFASFWVLNIAVLGANLFHQGYWQRVWAARDMAALRWGCVIGSVPCAIVMVLFGVSGMLAKAQNPDADTSIAFFDLLFTSGLNNAWLFVVAVLAVAIVTGSVDTLQNAMVSIVSEEFSQRGWSVWWARVVVLIVNIPAIALAMKNIDVLKLFLVADLVCSACCAPICLCIWKKCTRNAAIFGMVSGIGAIVVQGWIMTGTFAGGWKQIGLPIGLYAESTLVSFILAVVVSFAATVIVAYIETFANTMDEMNALLNKNSNDLCDSAANSGHDDASPVKHRELQMTDSSRLPEAELAV